MDSRGTDERGEVTRYMTYSFFAHEKKRTDKTNDFLNLTIQGFRCRKSGRNGNVRQGVCLVRRDKPIGVETRRDATERHIVKQGVTTQKRRDMFTLGKLHMV